MSRHKKKKKTKKKYPNPGNPIDLEAARKKGLELLSPGLLKKSTKQELIGLHTDLHKLWGRLVKGEKGIKDAFGLIDAGLAELTVGLRDLDAQALFERQLNDPGLGEVEGRGTAATGYKADAQNEEEWDRTQC